MQGRDRPEHNTQQVVPLNPSFSWTSAEC